MILEFKDNNSKTAISIFIHKFLPTYKGNFEIPFNFNSFVVCGPKNTLEFKAKFNEPIIFFEKDGFLTLEGPNKISVILKESSNTICDIHKLELDIKNEIFEKEDIDFDISPIYNFLVSRNCHESTLNLNCFLKISILENIRLHRFHNSKTLPLEFSFIKSNTRFLYKPNSNLSNDHFFNLITDYIFNLFDIPYKTSKVYCKSSYIEMKDAKTLNDFTSREFRTLIMSHIENFITTFSISLLITHIFEIGDRTLDNMMIDSEGKFYNIDFEYIFGQDPKYFINLVIPHIISDFLQSDFLIYEKFKDTFLFYYYEIQTKSEDILLYCKKLYNEGTYTFDFYLLKTVFEKNVKYKILNNRENSMIEYDLDKAMVDYKTKVTHFINKIGKLNFAINFF